VDQFQIAANTTMNFYTQATTPSKLGAASKVLLQQMRHLLVCPLSVTILPTRYRKLAPRFIIIRNSAGETTLADNFSSG